MAAAALLAPSVAAALALARSARVPGPDLPYRPVAPRRRDEGLPVPAALDPVLRNSVAGGRFRPAASAGALHPVSVRLLAGPGAGLPTGQYAYEPGAHRLHPLGPPSAPVARGAFAVLEVAPERTVAHYRHRAWPLTLLDAGHTVAALVAAGAGAYCLDLAAGAVPRPPGRRTDGIPLAIVRLTADGELSDGPPAVQDGHRAAPHPEIARARGILRLLAAAGDRHGTWYTARRSAHPAVVRARRSADPAALATGRPPSRGVLRRVLTAARAAAPGGPEWWLAVGGDRPALLTGAGPGLRTEAVGPVLDTLAVRAAGQGWIARTGAVLLAVGCPSDAGPNRIRRDHLLAGYGIGHAQLAATALGLPARPVGSWQGADLGADLGGPAGRRWIVHGLAFAAPPDGHR
ncbi:nitroreductase [Streptomyces qinzhouensis]|uniref:Nitroreductase n=1 Tax=Streptomyces qinzhouensis TaxID=2599401 RepID=A0A5B8IQB1_9ACTN|nr:nitroreductase [Streptomyces qinzhouensis]